MLGKETLISNVHAVKEEFTLEQENGGFSFYEGFCKVHFMCESIFKGTHITSIYHFSRENRNRSLRKIVLMRSGTALNMDV